MLTRRGFTACALCAVAGFVAEGVAGPGAATTGVTRTILNQTDGPVAGYVIVEVRAEIEPGATVARHIHPGVESAYIIDGTLDLSVDGEKTRTVGPGESSQIPAYRPHSAKAHDTKVVIAATYVIEKGKPLAIPA